ncbi:MAG: restriction endonuclease subunit S [Lachnospiraceae bacterium]|nr:restriction endonuclease subunit S [Lachnospiraceae bacterium]
MSKIEELIKEKCPNGVEFRRLEECCNILDKKRKPVTKSAREAGEYPYYGANGIQDYVSDYIFDGTFVLVGEDGSVILPNGTPVVTWAEGKIWVNNHAHIIEAIDDVDLRYMYHFLQTVYVGDLIHGNIPKLNQGDFRQVEVAVPPIEVQQEIVRILDNFTELEAELKAELDARKMQYKYMLENILLLTDVEEYTLEEVFEMKNGYTPSKNSEEFWVDGTIDWFRMEDIRANGRYLNDSIQKITSKAVKKSGLFKANSIALSTSATIGEHALLEVDCLTNQRFTVFTPKKEFESVVNMEYMNYYFEEIDRWCLKHLNQGNFASVDMEALKKYRFPLPSITEQKRIVYILKKFDIICNDFTMGLPAEIEARHKQYEYYREKLLTFERKVV